MLASSDPVGRVHPEGLRGRPGPVRRRVRGRRARRVRRARSSRSPSSDPTGGGAGSGARSSTFAQVMERERGRPEVLLGVLPGEPVGDGLPRARSASPTTRPCGTSTCRRIGPCRRRRGRTGTVGRPFDRTRDVEPWVRVFNDAFADHPTPLQLDPKLIAGGLDDPDDRRRRHGPRRGGGDRRDRRVLCRRRPAPDGVPADARRALGDRRPAGPPGSRASDGSSSGPASSGCARSVSATSASRSTPATKARSASTSRRASSGAGPAIAGRDRSSRRRRPGPERRRVRRSSHVRAARTPRRDRGPAAARGAPRRDVRSRSPGSSTAGPRSRRRPARSTGACSGCRSSPRSPISSTGSSGGCRPTTIRLALIAGVFFAGDLTFWHHAIEYVGAGLATVLGNLQVLDRRRSSRGSSSGSGRRGRCSSRSRSCSLGVVLISGIVGTGAYGSAPAIGVVLGLATAICYAGYLLIIRRGGRDLRRPAGPVAIATASTAICRGGSPASVGRRPRPRRRARRACSGWRCSASPRSSSATC